MNQKPGKDSSIPGLVHISSIIRHRLKRPQGRSAACKLQDRFFILAQCSSALCLAMINGCDGKAEVFTFKGKVVFI